MTGYLVLNQNTQNLIHTGQLVSVFKSQVISWDNEIETVTIYCTRM
jgi:hypothetical protein